MADDEITLDAALIDFVDVSSDADFETVKRENAKITEELSSKLFGDLLKIMWGRSDEKKIAIVAEVLMQCICTATEIADNQRWLLKRQIDALEAKLAAMEELVNDKSAIRDLSRSISDIDTRMRVDHLNLRQSAADLEARLTKTISRRTPKVKPGGASHVRSR